MIRGVTFFVLLSLCAPAWADPAPAAMRITIRPAAAPVPALKIRLLPEVSTVFTDNAAPLYYRAVVLAGKDFPDDIVKKVNAWCATPLDKLPRDEARQIVERYRDALQELAYASRRHGCEWGQPLGDIQHLYQMLLPEISPLRRLSNVLALRARLHLAEGNFDKAFADLGIGFALARHLGQGPFLLYGLVGNAVAQVMGEQLRDLVQQPGAPNLFWSLTALPSQFLDLRRQKAGEELFLYHDFPLLREVDHRAFAKAEVQELEKIFETAISLLIEDAESDTKQTQQVARAAVKQITPEARKYLLAQGKTAAEVDALPTAQAVAIYSMYQYHRFTDDLLKYAGVPYWQAHAGLTKTEAAVAEAKKKGDGMPFLIAVASFGRVQRRMANVERGFAALRVIEAVRLHAAANGGKLPASLDEITAVPLPVDPFTGKPFAYSVSGEAATLSSPAVVDVPALRYELTTAK